MPDVIVERAGGAMVLTLNRPERMNSLGGTLLADFNAALLEGRSDDSVRAIVVTGAGRAWCAGADLQAVGSGGGGNENSKRWGALDPIGDVGRTVLNIRQVDKPMIAAVNGVTVGGGFGLCSAFDIRIASDQARFSTVFIKRALAPDCGLSWFLPKLVGPERASEMFFTGRMVDANEAKEIGIVSRVVPHDDLMDSALALAHGIANSPPTAMALTRRAIHHSQISTLEAHLEFEWVNQKSCLRAPEFQEGVKSFLEKRDPDWSKF
ncbi:MAG: enoyl-CoA hydratase/isomerase family protein [bacterium]